MDLNSLIGVYITLSTRHVDQHNLLGMPASGQAKILRVIASFTAGDCGTSYVLLCETPACPMLAVQVAYFQVDLIVLYGAKSLERKDGRWQPSDRLF
jgi:ABC-type Na+ transport system ATPase subunit NatA